MPSGRTETAAGQINRIVSMVAELSRREAEGAPPPTLDELADSLETTRRQILRDIRILTEAGDEPESTWLATLRAYQDGDRVSVSSLGPYRRPIRFTAEEALALQVALVTEPDVPSRVLRELADLDEPVRGEAGRTVAPVPFLHSDEAAIVDLARIAMNSRQRLNLVYADEGGQVTDRVIQPHDVVLAEGKCYISAWCELREEWRFFRADRVLESELLPDNFVPRPDRPVIESSKDLLRAEAERTDDVTIRFSPEISRWIRERYPEAEQQQDGSVVASFPTASVDWLVRTVLQYGPDAEVLDPPMYRGAMRTAMEEMERELWPSSG